jgi:type II restriction/modification system DNA methylase subunit YeeA
VRGLFDAMSTGGEFSLEDIPHFDGGLFSEGGVVPLEAGELKVLAEAARLDWSSVEPAIFGTLFERSLDPSQRARLGAHYTSKEDILAIVEPVLMAPLRREWEAAKAKASAEAENATTQTGRRAANTLQRAERELYTFAEQLRKVSVLDPACGSGNFLYVSLKELLDLEKEVSTFAGEIGLTPFFPEVSPEQLYGIETSPYAHELAQVAIWIGYLQWLVENGFGARQEPILGPMTNIVEMDAILARDEAGTLREPDWPEAHVIVGNPPFLGGNKIRAELGGNYVESLFELYRDRVPAFADLVCYWFERTREHIEAGKVQRAGLLATNSIRGGVNRRVLERIKESGDIFFAESDRPWILNGAAVRVSMIGFDSGTETAKLLDSKPADAIHANLTAAANLSTARRLPENVEICFMGPSPKAPFDIDADVARNMLAAPINVNNRPNSDVVRPVASAVDIVRRSRNKWTIDFALMPFEEASLYELPFEYVREHVLPIRNESRRNDFQGQWWRYARPRPELREALKGKTRFITTPAVAKHRVFVWMSSEVLCNQGTLVFARDDDYFFGVLHSRAHELWHSGWELSLVSATIPATHQLRASRPFRCRGRPEKSRKTILKCKRSRRRQSG